MKDSLIKLANSERGGGGGGGASPALWREAEGEESLA